jgi:hypothetical protein
MKVKVLYIITGLFSIFFALIGLEYDINSYKVQKNGNLIVVKIIYVPKCIGTKTRQHIKFQYLDNGVLKESTKRIGGRLCEELKIGQELNLKTDVEKKIFLYENENVLSEFYTSGILISIGLFLIILGLFRKKQK